jgi:curved DNA-binding protein CbpA
MKLDSKLFDRIRVRREARVEPDAPQCQWDGCAEAATHRAPVGRHKEGEYFRFCLDHVRQYNRGYNYFSGLNDTDIARFQKEALTGHRPTWTIAGNGSASRMPPEQARRRSGRAGYHARMGDPFNLFGADAAPAAPRQRRAKPLEAKALETLGLDEKAGGEQIKARYKELVKRHHPDSNGGDRGSEERFRDVLEAYRLLRQSGFC